MSKKGALDHRGKTCFVIMGFGVKTDFRTGRDIDLDKTYKNIIKPAFEELGFVCIRADEIIHSGYIDIHMYDQIIKSDIVIADISTLNANVIYELGIRHAVKKHTTLIISEKQLTNPFDLSHINIDTYEHLGKSIDYDEVMRFRELIQNKVTQLLSSPKTDSPLYSFFTNLNTPTFTSTEVKQIIVSSERESTSLYETLKRVDDMKNIKDYSGALGLLNEVKMLYPTNEYLVRKLALVTYKSEFPSPKEALFSALEIINELKPDNTTDPETLGLCGAINKRLYYEFEEDDTYLDKAIWYYTRGFYVKQDYYNGINAVYLYILKASISSELITAFANYGQAMSIRSKVYSICTELVNSKSFTSRDDSEWIIYTLAECSVGIGDYHQEQEWLEYLNKLKSSEFAKNSYAEQRGNLVSFITLFKEKWSTFLP